MTLQTIPGAWSIPWSGMSGAAGYASTLLNADPEKVGAVFQVPKTGNIRTIRFKMGTVTTGDTLKGGIYTVDASGDPTTTAYGSMVAGTVVVADADDNVEKTITLGTDAGATAGAFVSLVLEFNARVGGNLNIQLESTGQPGLLFPYKDTFNTGAWVKTITAMVFAIGYDDGTYVQIPGVEPWTVVSGLPTTAFNVDTASADEYGLKFQIPYKARCRGAIVTLGAGAGADFEVKLYDTDGTTALQTLTVVANLQQTTTVRAKTYLFATAQSISINANYRLTLRPTTTTDITLQEGIVGTAAAMDGAPGGQNWHETKRLNSGGAWTDTTTRRPFIIPLFDQLDDGVGGGAGGGGPLVGGRLVL